METKFDIDQIVYKVSPHIGGGVSEQKVLEVKMHKTSNNNLVIEYKLQKTSIEFETAEEHFLFSRKQEAILAFKTHCQGLLDTKILKIKRELDIIP